MFVGHYGVSFVAKRSAPVVSLAALFLAVQLLDVGWSLFVLLGIEKVRIVPGITATNPLDLYYMPYTHSLVAALLWATGAALVYRLATRPVTWRPALWIGTAVFSHWVLDFIVHRPDLPLYDDSAKVGLGLWNYPMLSLVLEIVSLFGGLWWYLASRPVKRMPFVIFGLVMLALQCYIFFGPPPPSDRAVAATALGSYAAFALIIQLIDRYAGRQAVGH